MARGSLADGANASASHYDGLSAEMMAFNQNFGGLAMSSDNLTVTCPHCGRQSRMPPGITGRTVRCPYCKETWKVPGGSQQASSISSSGPAGGVSGAERGGSPYEVSDPFALLSQTGGDVTAPVESTFSASTAPGMATAPRTSAPPAWPMWWFLLGGLSVLLLISVVVAIVVVVVLFLQRSPQPAPPSQPPPVIAEPAPPQPNPEDELARKGAATAAFLEAVFNESRKVLGDFSNLTNLGAGGASLPPDTPRRLAAMEQALARLDTTDVDPVALQFKDRYVSEFKRLLNTMATTSQNLNAALQGGNPEAVLNMAEQLGVAQSEYLKATSSFFEFLNTEGRRVKTDLESRYHRSFPMPLVPQ